MKLVLFLVVALALSSCDAFVSLTYVVKNKSDKPVKVFVPGYFRNGYDRGRDTILEIKPQRDVMVGSTLPRVTVPIGAIRRIYRENPGLCGLKRMLKDSLVEVPCTRTKWKLRRGCATLIIRK